MAVVSKFDMFCLQSSALFCLQSRDKFVVPHININICMMRRIGNIHAMQAD